jgi:hypothetical protein
MLRSHRLAGSLPRRAALDYSGFGRARFRATAPRIWIRLTAHSLSHPPAFLAERTRIHQAASSCDCPFRRSSPCVTRMSIDCHIDVASVAVDGSFHRSPFFIIAQHATKSRRASTRSTSIEGLKLSRFDKFLGLTRERIERIYRGSGKRHELKVAPEPATLTASPDSPYGSNRKTAWRLSTTGIRSSLRAN